MKRKTLPSDAFEKLDYILHRLIDERSARSSTTFVQDRTVPIRYKCSILAARALVAKILIKKWHHIVLKAHRHGTSVRARVNLKLVRNAVLIQDFV